VQEALKEVEQSCLAARLSTPADTFSYMGLMHLTASDGDSPAATASARPRAQQPASGPDSAKAAARAAFAGTVQAFLSKVCKEMQSVDLLDAVADKQARAFLEQRLPPAGVPPRPDPPLEELPPDARLRCVSPSCTAFAYRRLRQHRLAFACSSYR
jgi:hypothetical protein